MHLAFIVQTYTRDDAFFHPIPHPHHSIGLARSSLPICKYTHIISAEKYTLIVLHTPLYVTDYCIPFKGMLQHLLPNVTVNLFLVGKPGVFVLGVGHQ